MAFITLETAKGLMELLKSVFPDGKLHFVRSYISIVVDGYNYVAIRKRGEDKTQIKIWISEKNFKTATDLLNATEISYTNKGQHLYFTTDAKAVVNHSEMMLKLASLIKDSWEN
jgi:hypothetical protein